jgi:hypothetical protein
MDVALNGYEFCLNSENPLMKEHKSVFFKRQASILWHLIPAMDRFAPNGVVRRRVRKTDEKYRNLIGEPTPLMKYLSGVVEKLAIKFKKETKFDPFNRYPKEEPFKMYLYEKDGKISKRATPYKTIAPTKRPFEMKYTALRFNILSQILKFKRKKDKELDNYIIKSVKSRNFIAF